MNNFEVSTLSFFNVSSTKSVVPTGDVDSSITMSFSFTYGAIAFVAEQIREFFTR